MAIDEPGSPVIQNGPSLHPGPLKYMKESRRRDVRQHPPIIEPVKTPIHEGLM